jgi:hypothetical protein
MISHDISHDQPSLAIIGHHWPSSAIIGHQQQSAAIGSNQQSSAVISSNQQQSAACSGVAHDAEVMHAHLEGGAEIILSHQHLNPLFPQLLCPVKREDSGFGIQDPVRGSQTIR